MTLMEPRRLNPTRTRHRATDTDYSTHHTWGDNDERREEPTWPEQWRNVANKLTAANSPGPSDSATQTPEARTGGRHRRADWNREYPIPLRGERAWRDDVPRLAIRPNDYGPDDIDSEQSLDRPTNRGAPNRRHGGDTGADHDDIDAVNLAYWRDRARDITDQRPTARHRWIVHQRWTTVYIGDHAIPRPSRPFAYRRPTAAPVIGRYPVTPPDWPPRHLEHTPAPRATTTSSPRTNPPTLEPRTAPEPRPAPLPERRQANETGTIHNTRIWPVHDHEPAPASCPRTVHAERPTSTRLEPTPEPFSHKERPTTFDENHHRPRRNPFRRFLRRVFGEHLNARPWWWAKTCRTCRSEWPCAPLITHLHQRYPDITVTSTNARDTELDRLSHP